MLRQFTAGLLATAALLAPLPASAQEEGSAEDLGVMSISLMDVVKPTIGFQGALQGANPKSSRYWWVLAPLCWREQRFLLWHS